MNQVLASVCPEDRRTDRQVEHDTSSAETELAHSTPVSQT